MSPEVTEIVAKILTAYGSLKNTGKDSHENTAIGLGGLALCGTTCHTLGQDRFLPWLCL